MKTNMTRAIRIGATVALLAAAGLMAQPLLAQRAGARAGGPRTPPLLLTTSAWEDGGVIPDKYTMAAGAATVSPALQWSQVPPGTRSFVLLVHDPEPVLNKSTKMDITHWLIWNIPGTATGLPEGVKPGGDLPDGSHQISASGPQYRGPGAAATGPLHHYTFEVYALDTKLDVIASTATQVINAALETRASVMKAMNGHVLGKAVYVGLFKRPQ